jgi:hypothetical protein
MLQKKIWANFQRIIELLTQKIVTKLSKIWVWIRDPRSGIQGIKGTGSRIGIRNTAFFPSPAGMLLPKLSLAGNNLIIPGQGEFWLVTSRQGTGKKITFFIVYIQMVFA